MTADSTEHRFIFENEHVRLTVSDDTVPQSLLLKKSGRELLCKGQKVSLFCVTQARPFNNEVKLMHPNKRTDFPSVSMVREDGAFTVRFETVPVKVRIAVKEETWGIVFSFLGFQVEPEDYSGLSLTPPPVEELRILQLPVLHQKHFGNWLGVSSDEVDAVCIAAAAGGTLIDSEKRAECRILYAKGLKETGVSGCCAALLGCPTESFLDCMEAFEQAFHLPEGVKSRRTAPLNSCVYFTDDITPLNAEEHIRYAKQGGFRLMQIYYHSIFKEEDHYRYIGNYDYRPEYPGKRKDLEAMLEKIKAAGIIPGLHVLQTHIGLKSRYVTPKADPRLHLTQYYTLAAELPGEDDGKPFDLYVFENPFQAPRCRETRILKFGTELISYEDFCCEAPYHFSGCRRGDHATDAVSHPAGEIGGVLDVSEFCAESCYLDQRTDLQDEIAEKIAEAYNAGFEFMYLDGSEGTNPPYEYHVPNAQMRVYRRLASAPLYVEGAAKSHFSWHMLSGGNAFDVFPPEIFKEKLAEFPAAEAPSMRNNFTRVDFGWWYFYAPGQTENGYSFGTQPDHYEFGTALAAGWDCPATVWTDLAAFRKHPRTADILEIMRRWEDVRAKGLLTEEQKELLRDSSREHKLLIAEDGSYELVEYRAISGAAGGDGRLRAYAFTRKDKSYVVYWHTDGEGSLWFPMSGSFVLKDGLDQPELPVEKIGGSSLLPAGHIRYIESSCCVYDLLFAMRLAMFV